MQTINLIKHTNRTHQQRQHHHYHHHHHHSQSFSTLPIDPSGGSPANSVLLLARRVQAFPYAYTHPHTHHSPPTPPQRKGREWRRGSFSCPIGSRINTPPSSSCTLALGDLRCAYPPAHTYAYTRTQTHAHRHTHTHARTHSVCVLCGGWAVARAQLPMLLGGLGGCLPSVSLHSYGRSSNPN